MKNSIFDLESVAQDLKEPPLKSSTSNIIGTAFKTLFVCLGLILLLIMFATIGMGGSNLLENSSALFFGCIFLIGCLFVLKAPRWIVIFTAIIVGLLLLF